MSTGRRNFIKTSALAALGATLAPSVRTVSAAPSGRPFVTGVKGKKVVGCYVGVAELLSEPKYIDALQKQLGVNAVIVSPPAIKMPAWLKEMNPLKGKAWMGTSPIKDDDDSQLVKAIDEAHRRGMDAWLYYTGHHYGEFYRPASAVTFDEPQQERTTGAVSRTVELSNLPIADQQVVEHMTSISEAARMLLNLGNPRSAEYGERILRSTHRLFQELQEMGIVSPVADSPVSREHRE
jgi:hypothetical protein